MIKQAKPNLSNSKSMATFMDSYYNTIDNNSRAPTLVSNKSPYN